MHIGKIKAAIKYSLVDIAEFVGDKVYLERCQIIQTRNIQIWVMVGQVAMDA